MYCGDETGSFIGEIGSHSCRFGYGGEDNPKLVLPSYVGNKSVMAGSPNSTRLAQQEIESILRRPEDTTVSLLTDPNAFWRQGDLVEHWDNLQTAWETGMEVLHAKDTLKHTKGGTPFTKTTAASASDGKCVHPILAITPGFTHYDGYGPSYCASLKRQQYIQYTELLMEQMEASSLFLAPAPMLAAFSVGRQTAMVVDIGAGGTRVTPVVDGLLLHLAQRRSGRGGDWLGHVTWKALLEEKITPKPRYWIRQDSMSTQQPPARSPLFHSWAIQDLMYELRTQPFVTLDVTPSSPPRVPFMKFSTSSQKKDAEMEETDRTGSPPPPHASIASTPGAAQSSAPSSSSSSSSSSSPLSSAMRMPSIYQFPDGTTVNLTETTLGKDLTYIPELFFAKTLPFNGTNTDTNTISNRSPTITDAPLQELIHQSLLAVGDVDVRKELASNIVLTGGSSLFPNLDARLSYELSNLLPAFTKPKVIAPRFSVERSCASWIGASILTSLGSFQQLWLSRTEYEEYGSTMAIQRFP